MKTIFDMIQHFSSLFITFNTVMTGFEDLRQVARIARSEGWALDILIRRLACLLSKNEWHCNATRFSSCENSAKIVGQTPWSARVPLDPLFATGSISSKREGRPGGRPRTGGPPHNFCRPSGHGKNERHWADSLRYLVTNPQWRHNWPSRVCPIAARWKNGCKQKWCFTQGNTS